MVAVDRLGQGHTDNPPTPSDYSFDAVMAHLETWWGAVGLQDTCVVGDSRGGLVAALLALRHPARVRRLVIIDSATLAPTDPRWDAKDFYDALETQLTGEDVAADVRTSLEAHSYNPGHVSERYIATALERIATEGFHCPTLLFWGRNDPSARLPLCMDLLDRIAEKTDDVQVHIVNHAGHASFREQPHVFNDVLATFCG